MENQDFVKLIKDIPTENVYVLTEKDANVVKMLRLLPGNRPTKPQKVEKLVEAFKDGLYIPPILVALPYRFVTEGNHRVAAVLKCIELKIPFTLRVYMYKDDASLETARLINNTQDRWKANDRLHSYIHENKESYMRLKKFMDAYPNILRSKENVYAIQASLCVLAQDRQKHSLQNAFNSGKLVITEANLEYGHQLMQELILMSEILESTSVFGRDHTTAWSRARTRLGMSFGQFIVRLKKKAPNWGEPKDSMEAWFNMYIKVAGGI